MRPVPPRTWLRLWALALALLCGCAKSDGPEAGEAKTPRAAATHLEQAFANAPAPTRQTAGVVSEALRQGNFEKAVVSLQFVQTVTNITLEQGLAVHGVKINLERELINAIERGDPNAQRAYDLLKRMKRN